MAAVLEQVQDWSNVVIAYEPVWDIGTGKTASSEDAQSATAAFRSWLERNLSANVANATRILQGGSVDENNAADLIAKPDIDGFLVGDAALKHGFLDIIAAANAAKL